MPEIIFDLQIFIDYMNCYTIWDLNHYSLLRMSHPGEKKCQYPDCPYVVRKLADYRVGTGRFYKDGDFCLKHACSHDTCRNPKAPGHAVCLYHICAAPNCQAWHTALHHANQYNQAFCSTHACVRDGCENVKLDGKYVCYQHYVRSIQRQKKRKNRQMSSNQKKKSKPADSSSSSEGPSDWELHASTESLKEAYDQILED